MIFPDKLSSSAKMEYYPSSPPIRNHLIISGSSWKDLLFSLIGDISEVEESDHRKREAVQSNCHYKKRKIIEIDARKKNLTVKSNLYKTIFM